MNPNLADPTGHFAVRSQQVCGGSTQRSLSRFAVFSFLFYFVGSLVNVIAYEHYAPALVGTFFLCSAIWLLGLSSMIDHSERQAFILVYSVCWFWAGVAAIYANYLNDFGQNELDARYFFDIVTTGDAASLSVTELFLHVENGGAMLIWRVVYDFFSILGMQKEPYIGVSLNILLVSLTCIVGIRIVKAIFGNDPIRIRRYTVLFAFCGMFWLYASIHLRDAAVLFSVTLLALYWAYYLADTSATNLVRVLVASALGTLVLGSLRKEFYFISAGMLLAAFAAVHFSKRRSKNQRTMLCFLLFVIVMLNPGYCQETLVKLIDALGAGNQSYTDHSDSQSYNSFGNALIVQQSLPIRLTLGTFYLFVFPVPFWQGFQLESAYHLLKSFHVLYMYAVTPLFALTIWRIIRCPQLRTAPVMFLLFVVLGITAGVAYSSLENRHFGAILGLLLCVAMIPDLSELKERTMYTRMLLFFVGSVGAVHLAWLVLKA